jgi:hypothetical protein
MNKVLEVAACVGIVLLGYGVLTQDAEGLITGLASIVFGIVWDFAHDRRLTGAQVIDHWRPSARKLRIAGYALAAFAVATAIGVWQGSIPAGLVIAMLCFVIAGPILAAPFLIAYRRSKIRARQSEDWPQVTGHVVNAFTTEAGEWPAPIVIYRYEVAGRTYNRSRVRFGGTGGMNPMEVERVTASFPTGADVPVYYDPKRPGRSVLMPGSARLNKGLLWGAGGMVAICLLAALAMALFVLLGFVDMALTAIFGHRVLP